MIGIEKIHQKGKKRKCTRTIRKYSSTLKSYYIRAIMLELSRIAYHLLWFGLKCVEIEKNTNGESTPLADIDTEIRKLGERMGLDTPVVLAINDGS